MKKIFYALIIFFIIPIIGHASEKVDLYLFWGDGCPHCAHEKEYLEGLEKKYDNLNVHLYEVWYNEDNAKKMEKLKKSFSDEATLSVPFTVIGEKSFSGHSDQIGSEIKAEIDKCQKKKCL